MITKKIYKLAIIGLALLSLSACSESNNKSKLPNTQTGINKVLDEQVKNADNNLNTDKSDDLNSNSENKDSNSDINNKNNDKTNSNTDNSDTNTGTDEENIDYDITTMSSEMVYATVYQLVTYPENYIGKKVKIGGQYYTASNEEVQKHYHYVIIADATECCTQGIEFVWTDGNHIYPDEYPEEGTVVEVVGIFESYIDEDDGLEYCRLKNSSMKIID